jgi:hypothetical protein
MAVDEKDLDQLLEKLNSGQLAEEFEHSSEERRYELLDFLERLIELGEAADKLATQIIFKNSALGQLVGQSQDNS